MWPRFLVILGADGEKKKKEKRTRLAVLHVFTKMRRQLPPHKKKKGREGQEKDSSPTNSFRAPSTDKGEKERKHPMECRSIAPMGGIKKGRRERLGGRASFFHLDEDKVRGKGKEKGEKKCAFLLSRRACW